MDKATVTTNGLTQAAGKEEAKGKVRETVQAANAAGNLREAITAEA
jgi:hypothetical protein